MTRLYILLLAILFAGSSLHAQLNPVVKQWYSTNRWNVYSNGTGDGLTHRMISPVDVRVFGAVGDGVTDDTAEIQAAFDTAVGLGRHIYFPPGTYLVSSNMVFGSIKGCLSLTNLDGTLFMDGYGATIKVADGNTAIYGFIGPQNNGGEIVMRGLTWDENMQNRETNIAFTVLFGASQCKTFRAIDCVFTNIIRNGLYSSASESTVVDSCRFYGSCPGTNGSHFYVDEGHVKVMNSYFQDAGAFGPDQHPARRQGVYHSSTCASGYYAGNTFTNCAIGTDTRSPGCVVVGNTYWGGINGTHTNFTVGQIHHLTYPGIIADNYIMDFTNQIGIWLTDATNCIVRNNFIRSGGRDYWLQRMINCFGGGNHQILNNIMILPQSGVLQHTMIDTSHSLSTNNVASGNFMYGARFGHKASTNIVTQLWWLNGNHLNGTAFPFYNGTVLGRPDQTNSINSMKGIVIDGVELPLLGLHVEGLSTLVGTVNATGNVNIAGNLLVEGTRDLYFDNNTGELSIQANTGGWVTGFKLKGYDGTDYANFGAFGNSNDLRYLFIGPEYNNRWMTFSNYLVWVNGSLFVDTNLTTKDLSVSGNNAAVDYVWTCTNATTGAGEWRVSTGSGGTNIVDPCAITNIQQVGVGPRTYSLLVSSTNSTWGWRLNGEAGGAWPENRDADFNLIESDQVAPITNDQRGVVANIPSGDVGGYLRCDATNEPNFSAGEFTISFWVKPDELPDADNRTILSKKSSYTAAGSPGYMMVISNDARIHFKLQDTNDAEVVVVSDPIDLEWSKIDVRGTLSGADLTVDIFVNGAKDDTAVFASVGSTDNAEKFYLGTDGLVVDLYLGGYYSDLKIWNYALTDCAIESDFTGCLCEKVVQVKSLEPGYGVIFTNSGTKLVMAIDTNVLVSGSGEVSTAQLIVVSNQTQTASNDLRSAIYSTGITNINGISSQYVLLENFGSQNGFTVQTGSTNILFFLSQDLEDIHDAADAAANGSLLLKTNNTWIGLPVGTNGQVLTMETDAYPRWKTPSTSGGASPTTTLGDMIVRGASADERLGVGINGNLLTIIDGRPNWMDEGIYRRNHDGFDSAAGTLITTKGGQIVSSGPAQQLFTGVPAVASSRGSRNGFLQQKIYPTNAATGRLTCSWVPGLNSTPVDVLHSGFSFETEFYIQGIGYTPSNNVFLCAGHGTSSTTTNSAGITWFLDQYNTNALVARCVGVSSAYWTSGIAGWNTVTNWIKIGYYGRTNAGVVFTTNGVAAWTNTDLTTMPVGVSVMPMVQSAQSTAWPDQTGGTSTNITVYWNYKNDDEY